MILGYMVLGWGSFLFGWAMYNYWDPFGYCKQQKKIKAELKDLKEMEKHRNE